MGLSLTVMTNQRAGACRMSEPEHKCLDQHRSVQALSAFSHFLITVHWTVLSIQQFSVDQLCCLSLLPNAPSCTHVSLFSFPRPLIRRMNTSLDHLISCAHPIRLFVDFHRSPMIISSHCFFNIRLHSLFRYRFSVNFLGRVLNFMNAVCTSLNSISFCQMART